MKRTQIVLLAVLLSTGAICGQQRAIGQSSPADPFTRGLAGSWMRAAFG